MHEYFHDPQSRTLYQAPLNPQVSEKKNRSGDVIMTTVSAYIKGISFGPHDSGQSEDTSYPAKDFYDHRDSREQAVQNFKRSKYPSGNISASEYHELYTKYSASIKAEQRS